MGSNSDDLEKDIDGIQQIRAQQDRHLAPATPATHAPIEKIKSNRSGRSLTCGDGYYVFDTENEASNSTGEEDSADKEWEVKFDGDDDPFNPKGKSKFHKWLIVLIVSSCSTCVTCVSSMYTSAYPQLIPEFHTSREVATLGLSLYVFGLGIGPMFLAPLSEFYGRRPIYIYSFACFIIWLIPCAVANNMATLLVGRFLDGVAGAAFLSVAGGTVGDLFSGTELSGPMMVYTASPFAGPEVGPIVGGFITTYTTWRWIFYVLLIWSGVQLALIIAFVPETYHPVMLRNKARQLRKDTGEERWYAPIERMDKSIVQTIMWSCIRPFQLLFFEPMVLNLCLLSALLLGIIYLFFGAFALIFADIYHFTLWQTGLSFLGIMVGLLIGVSCDPIWKRKYIQLIERRQAREGDDTPEPEFRLPSTIFGAILVPIGLFGFAWTTYPFVHWIVPIVFSGIFGLGTIWIYSGVFTFLVQSYPLYAASAMAANSIARSTFAAVFPLFGDQMYENLGYQWASSLLAFLALGMSPFPYIFYRYGKSIRKRSRYAST